MLKIAVIGGRETVMGFKALGLDVFPVSGADEARKVLRSATGEGSEYAIIYIAAVERAVGTNILDE